MTRDEMKRAARTFVEQILAQPDDNMRIEVAEAFLRGAYEEGVLDGSSRNAFMVMDSIPST